MKELVLTNIIKLIIKLQNNFHTIYFLKKSFMLVCFFLFAASFSALLKSSTMPFSAKAFAGPVNACRSIWSMKYSPHFFNVSIEHVGVSGITTVVSSSSSSSSTTGSGEVFNISSTIEATVTSSHVGRHSFSSAYCTCM